MATLALKTAVCLRRVIFIFLPKFNDYFFVLGSGLEFGEYYTIPEYIFRNEDNNKAGDIGTGVLDVFDRYNFTIKEDEPLDKEVAVDPEMLGEVFENMLEITERKSKGAFIPRARLCIICARRA